MHILERATKQEECTQRVAVAVAHLYNGCGVNSGLLALALRCENHGHVDVWRLRVSGNSSRLGIRFGRVYFGRQDLASAFVS